MPISPVRDASGTTYRTAPRQPSQEELANSAAADPARFLRLVLYSFVVVLLEGVLLAFLPPAHVPDTRRSGAENTGTAQSDTERAIRTDTLKPDQQGSTTTASNTSAIANGTITANTIHLSKGSQVWLLVLAGLSLLIGSLMFFGMNLSLKKSASGAAVAAVGLTGIGTATGALLKDIKIDALFKFDKLFTVDQKLPPGSTPAPSFSIYAEPVGIVGPFLSKYPFIGSGGHDTPEAKAAVKSLLQLLETQPLRDQAALVLLIGSADKKPLRGQLRLQFYSNVGLAQARAEWVRDQLVADSPGIQEKLRFLVLTSGPRGTGVKTSAEDLERDRSVQAWVLYGASLQTFSTRPPK
jgi:hypothetical protein